MTMEQAIANVRPLADTIWASLVPLRGEYARPRLLFVGAEPRAGTTLICAATAIGLARHLSTEISLVEATLQRPAVADYLGVPRGPGLSDVLDRRSTLEQARQRHPKYHDLLIIPAGSPRPPIPGEFATEEGRAILREITSRGSFVLFDAPPLQSHAETRLLLEHVDAVVLVLRARSTRSSAVKEVQRILGTTGTPIVGTVLNRYKSDMPFSND